MRSSASIGRRAPSRRTLLLGAASFLGVFGLVSEAQSQSLFSALSPQMAEYRRKLEVYTAARNAFEAKASIYWNEIAEKRRQRIAKRRAHEMIALEDYVLNQPPVYSGPARPADPSAQPEDRPRKTIPVVADFLEAAQTHFGFAPERPRSEIEFKRAYARAAAAAGITREQAVRVFAFESGGNGHYEVQAGLETQRPGARAISTALGYNQLLTTNTVSLFAERGDHFLKTLKAKSARLVGEPKRKLDHKTAILHRMITVARSVPVAWSEHEKLGTTGPGLGMHAMVLDLDVGPLLQTQKLLDSILFARVKGLTRPLSAAELEMMNLTGDGNGFDMVSMPLAMRDSVPTSNFFQRGGYERNPVAIRNNTVARLIAATNARMDREVNLPGAKDLAASFSTDIVRSD